MGKGPDITATRLEGVALIHNPISGWSLSSMASVILCAAMRGAARADTAPRYGSY